MSQSPDETNVPGRLRIAIGNFLQKFRGILIGIVIVGILVVVGLAVWTQIDNSTKNEYAAKIEKSQTDLTAWQAESDETKKAALGDAVLAELKAIEQKAPQGYGLSKAWFLEGTYFAEQEKWTEASAAFEAVSQKGGESYLAPIALVNAAVAQENAGNSDEALRLYENFDKTFSGNLLLGPQVLFTEGRLLESQGKNSDAVSAYKKLVEKYPEAGWTKLGRDRILLLSQD